MQKYCIIKQKEKICSLLLDEDGNSLEIHMDGPESELTIGAIFIGRVKNIAKNIRAAFVEIRPGYICYLPLDQLQDPIYTKKGNASGLQQGDELVVQISREAIKTKEPALTTHLSLQGKYAVLEAGEKNIGISRKLSLRQRERLRKLAEQEMQPQGFCGKYGLILRTNAAEVPEETVRKEIQELSAQLSKIIETSVHRTCYSCLYQPPARWLQRLNSLRCSETEAVIVEDNILYETVKEYLPRENSEWSSKLRHYQDKMLPMDKLFSLERRMKEVRDERVWLKSGAYLVIQPTEALTVVDVNTGKFEKGKEKEAAVRKVNLEAAEETARQIRLRNLSGIIIVDFINMKEEASKKQVMEKLRRCLAADPVQAQVVDMTKLNLVEITRKKVEKPLLE